MAWISPETLKNVNECLQKRCDALGLVIALGEGREGNNEVGMEQYVIKGGIPLVGEVDIAGAKNAALPIISASIMTDETVTLENLPDVNDINVLLEAIEQIGARVERLDRHTVKINGSTIANCSVDYECIKKIRASYYLLGALLGKYNSAEVPLPGGCNIGSRPIDQHLKGFRAIGANVEIRHGTIIAKCDRMIADGKEVTLSCGFCEKKYSFSIDELKEIEKSASLKK